MTISNSPPVTVAVVQAASVAFDRDRTLEKLRALAADAAKGKARLVLFPEAFVSGYPSGFDFYAQGSAGTVEMGGETRLSESPTLIVATPKLRRPDPDGTLPDIRTIVWRAIEGGWEEVAGGATVVRYRPDRSGAFRAETRIVPRHLRDHLHAHADLAEIEHAWIYSNPIYVTD